jgi:polyisoprenoid-binding protein YceI
MASRAGHDLVLEVGRWQATLVVRVEPGASSLRLQADGGSLHAREGHGGVKPLSDRDRAEIRRTITSKVLRGARIAFRSSHAESADAGGLRFTGELSIGDATHPVTFELSMAGDELAGTATVTQSDWGISPYRGFMGALKVRDDVEVVFRGRVPPGT